MSIVFVAIAVLVPSLGRADSFEAQVGGAVRVKRIDDLVWTLTAPCDRGDEVQNRQCRQLRDRKAKLYVGAKLLVDGEAGAFELGKWNAARRSLPVTLSACIRCAGIEVDGKGWYLLATGGPPRFENGKLRGGVLHDNARGFPDEASATAWAQAVQAVQVQLVVKVPDSRRWQLDGKDGLWLDVVAYRVVDPCGGGVILASPPSGPAEADPQACGAGRAGVEITGAGEHDALTAPLVRDAMKPVVDAASACFAKLKAAGKSKLELTVNGDGSVAKFELTGDFANTPTGDCVAAAVKAVRFPSTKRPTTRIGFPIVLP